MNIRTKAHDGLLNTNLLIDSGPLKCIRPSREPFIDIVSISVLHSQR